MTVQSGLSQEDSKRPKSSHWICVIDMLYLQMKSLEEDEVPSRSAIQMQRNKSAPAPIPEANLVSSIFAFHREVICICDCFSLCVDPFSICLSQTKAMLTSDT